MARKIKGITIEIGGNTTKLDKAIKSSNAQLRTMQSDLKDVERLLKLDPGNTELLAQKQRILAERVETTKEKLTTLNSAMKDAGEALDRNNAYEKVASDLEAAKQAATEAGDKLVAMQNKLEQLQGSDAPGAADQIKETENAIAQLSDTVDSADVEVRELQAALEEIKGPKLTQDEFDALQRELIETEQSAKDAEEAFSDFNSGVEEFKRKATEISSSAGSIKDAFSPVTTAVAGIAAAAIATVPATEELRSDLSKLDNNARTAGVGVDAARSAFEQFAVVSDETDSSVEAVSNLLQAGFTESNLQLALENLAGAYLSFPDTMKIESLADSLQETLATGEATGQFAELLDRLGISAESFSAGLAACTTETEKQSLALSTLANAGMADVYNGWLESNEALAANKEATLDLKQSLADLAEDVQPLVTTVTEFASKILDWFNSLDDGTKTTIVVIAGLAAAISPVAGAVEKVSGALPTLIDLFSKLNATTGLTVAGIVTFIALAAQVISAWSDMSSLERAVSVLGLLLVAVSTLAVALGALSGIGGAVLAAAGIAAGIAMVTSTVGAVNKRRSAANDTSLNAYPAYADGGVIPPNDPYLALVGDNKREREIIAPESTLRKIYREESSARSSSYTGSQTVVMQVDGVTFARVMAPYMDGEDTRRGVSIIGK